MSRLIKRIIPKNNKIPELDDQCGLTRPPNNRMVPIFPQIFQIFLFYGGSKKRFKFIGYSRRGKWMGCKDSNLGMTGPKPVGLPLADTPTKNFY